MTDKSVVEQTVTHKFHVLEIEKWIIFIIVAHMDYFYGKEKWKMMD